MHAQVNNKHSEIISGHWERRVCGNITTGFLIAVTRVINFAFLQFDFYY